MKHTDIGYLKYWLRIHGYHPGTIRNGNEKQPHQDKNKERR